jgi:hydrogenase maturation protein HypF
LGHRLSQGRVASLQAVPHHLAHGLAVAAEHGLDLPLLVLSFDGLGYGAIDRPAVGWGGAQRSGRGWSGWPWGGRCPPALGRRTAAGGAGRLAAPGRPAALPPARR